MQSQKKNVARLSEYLRFAREMAESTECSTCGRGGERGRLTERCAATFRRGRGARRADSPTAVDLTTARPTDAPVAIVYTLPIGSLFLSRATGRRALCVRDMTLREACIISFRNKETILHLQSALVMVLLST